MFNVYWVLGLIVFLQHQFEDIYGLLIRQQNERQKHTESEITFKKEKKINKKLHVRIIRVPLQ